MNLSVKNKGILICHRLHEPFVAPHNKNNKNGIMGETPFQIPLETFLNSLKPLPITVADKRGVHSSQQGAGGG